MCLEAVPGQPHLNRVLLRNTFLELISYSSLFVSGLESQNAFSIWQPLAQFSTTHAQLRTHSASERFALSLWKSSLLLLFSKPTSLVASTGAASDFFKGLYSHMGGRTLETLNFHDIYIYKGGEIPCIYSAYRYTFFPPHFRCSKDPRTQKKDLCPRELVYLLVLQGILVLFFPAQERDISQKHCLLSWAKEFSSILALS